MVDSFQNPEKQNTTGVELTKSTLATKNLHTLFILSAHLTASAKNSTLASEKLTNSNN